MYVRFHSKALMKTDARLTESIFQQASSRICRQGKSVAIEASAYIEALLSIIRNSELATVLREVSSTLKECCESIEVALGGNSSMEKQVVSLRTAVELLVGSMD